MRVFVLCWHLLPHRKHTEVSLSFREKKYVVGDALERDMRDSREMTGEAIGVQGPKKRRRGSWFYYWGIGLTEAILYWGFRGSGVAHPC